MSAVSGTPAVEEGIIPGGVQDQLARGRRARWAGPGAWLTARLIGLKHWLPKGQLLPEHVLRRRHRSICLLLWAHVPALFAFGMLVGHHSVVHVGTSVGLIALCGVGAS